MKKVIWSLYLLSILATPIVQTASFPSSDHSVRSTKPCRCFCAFKMGLREKKEGDNPFVKTFTKQNGQTVSLCLCKERDAALLEKDPCRIERITEKDIEGATCCQ